MKQDRDQRQFFKDLGATAEQTVEEVRGVEENYFSMMQKTMIPLPWIADLNAKLQSYAEQHLAAALEFAHKLSLAKDFQDLARIQAEFFQNQMQSLGEQTKDLAEAYTKSAASAIKGLFRFVLLTRTTSIRDSALCFAFTNPTLAPTPTARSHEMLRTSSFDEAIGWT